MSETSFGRAPVPRDVKVPLRPARLVVSWLLGAIALLVAALIVPGVDVQGFWARSGSPR